MLEVFVRESDPRIGFSAKFGLRSLIWLPSTNFRSGIRQNGHRIWTQPAKTVKMDIYLYFSEHGCQNTDFEAERTLFRPAGSAGGGAAAGSAAGRGVGRPVHGDGVHWGMDVWQLWIGPVRGARSTEWRGVARGLGR